MQRKLDAGTQTTEECLLLAKLPDELLLKIFNQAEPSLVVLSWVCSRFHNIIDDDSLKLKKHYQLITKYLADLCVKPNKKLFTHPIDDEAIIDTISNLKTALNPILEISRIDKIQSKLADNAYCPTGIEIEAFASETEQPIEYQNVFSIYNPSFFNYPDNRNGSRELRNKVSINKIQLINFVFKYMNTPVNLSVYQIIRLLLILDLSLQASESKQTSRWQNYGKVLLFSYEQIVELMGEKKASNCLLQLKQGIELAQQNSLNSLMDALVKIKNNIQKKYCSIERMDLAK